MKVCTKIGLVVIGSTQYIIWIRNTTVAFCLRLTSLAASDGQVGVSQLIFSTIAYEDAKFNQIQVSAARQIHRKLLHTNNNHSIKLNIKQPTFEWTPLSMRPLWHTWRWGKSGEQKAPHQAGSPHFHDRCPVDKHMAAAVKERLAWERQSQLYSWKNISVWSSCFFILFKSLR